LVFCCGTQSGVVLYSLLLFGWIDRRGADPTEASWHSFAGTGLGSDDDGSRSDLSLPGLESDMLRLLGERSVQEELQLSPAQLGMVARLAGTRREALSGSPGPRREEWAGRARQVQNQERALLENLKPEQAARLRQIAWQKRGP